jgi:hypothetical protein
MKAKWLSFVFICFSESGLFKGLRAKKIKKSRRFLTRVTGCQKECGAGSAFSFMGFRSPQSLCRDPRISVSRKYTKNSGFSQAFVSGNPERVAKDWSLPVACQRLV